MGYAGRENGGEAWRRWWRHGDGNGGGGIFGFLPLPGVLLTVASVPFFLKAARHVTFRERVLVFVEDIPGVVVRREPWRETRRLVTAGRRP